MIPVVTPRRMRAIDQAATVPLEELIGRAGWVVADEARRLLGGTYGKRVLVLAGPGNNGADGRKACDILRRWGVRCQVIEADNMPSAIRSVDLVIDACFGTGFRGEFVAPDTGTIPVIAVDISSGVDGLTGACSAKPFAATLTVCFAAPKPGNLIGPGAILGGSLVVRDIGLDVPPESLFWSDSTDLSRWPVRPSSHHKWQSAALIIGGHAAGLGAPTLSALAAAKAGASYVQFSVPGSTRQAGPIESVTVDSDQPVDERIQAIVLGPGLPVDTASSDLVRRHVEHCGARGLVLDAGALTAIAGAEDLVGGSSGAIVLTPHDGEYRQLAGKAPGPDRIEAARELAVAYNAVVLLKGPATIVADPNGTVVISTAGDQRLATAGSGDVLAGVIGAGLAQGLSAFDAAWLGTELVGRSLAGSPAAGLVAGELPQCVGSLVAELADGKSV